MGEGGGRSEGKQIEKTKRMRELMVLPGIRRGQTLASFHVMSLRFCEIFWTRRGIQLRSIDRISHDMNMNTHNVRFDHGFCLKLFSLELSRWSLLIDNTFFWHDYVQRRNGFPFPFDVISALISSARLRMMRSLCGRVCFIRFLNELPQRMRNAEIRRKRDHKISYMRFISISFSLFRERYRRNPGSL